MKDIFFFLSLHANDNFIFEAGIVSDDGLMPATEWWSIDHEHSQHNYSPLLHLAFYLLLSKMIEYFQRQHVSISFFLFTAKKKWSLWNVMPSCKERDGRLEGSNTYFVYQIDPLRGTLPVFIFLPKAKPKPKIYFASMILQYFTSCSLWLHSRSTFISAFYFPEVILVTLVLKLTNTFCICNIYIFTQGIHLQACVFINQWKPIKKLTS